LHTAPPAGIARRHVAAIAAGNALQFYDFVTYAFFAAQIGRAFFPSHDPTASLLASLATFGAGFVSRPLGALVLGRLGDRIGRKPALLISFALIGLSVAGLALTPSYAQIGVAAPILAVMLRLLQGFAVGGEVGPSTSFLLEAAPPHRRGLYVSMQTLGGSAAALVAGAIGVILSHALGPDAFEQWGWRIAFLIGAAILPFGLWLRRALPETLHAVSVDEPPPTTRARRTALLGLILIAASAISGYVLYYLTTYAAETLHMPADVALGATVVVGFAGCIGSPLGGWCSDRFGRKRAMLAPWIFLLVAVLPAFILLARFRTASALYGTCFLLSLAVDFASAAILVGITEQLPRNVRSGTLGLLYAGALAIFGGSTQFVIAWLTRATGNPIAPAWYLMGALAIAMIALVQMPETAPRLRERKAL